MALWAWRELKNHLVPSPWCGQGTFTILGLTYLQLSSKNPWWLGLATHMLVLIPLRCSRIFPMIMEPLDVPPKDILNRALLEWRLHTPVSRSLGLELWKKNWNFCEKFISSEISSTSASHPITNAAHLWDALAFPLPVSTSSKRTEELDEVWFEFRCKNDGGSSAFYLAWIVG